MLALLTLICEALVSVLLIAGGMWAMVYSPDQGVKQGMGVLVGGVAAYWFQRRAGDSATTTVATLANGKLSDLIQQQSTTNAKLAELTGGVAVANAASLSASSPAQR